MKFLEVQLAKLVKEAPEGEEWVHELKFDGYRIEAALEKKKVALWSRRGNDWTVQYPGVAAAVAKLPARSAVLDGEVCVVLPDGRTSFQALQNAQGRSDLVYFVFDLLELDGKDLRGLGLEERKRRLQELVAGSEVVRYSDHVSGRGAEFFRQACAKGLEGIISKRRDAPYSSGRGGGWVKTKCVQRQELVIGGFTDPEGSRVGIGALLVGYQEGGKLVFAGKVGTGFTHKVAVELRKKLEPMVIEKSPFATTPRKDAHYVKPSLVCEVEFTEWTDDGHIRHPSFKGLRADKKAPEVVQELPTDQVAGIKISNGERVMYPEVGITKLELCRYFEAVAERMLPAVAGRPLTLFWCPKGVAGDCRFMRHAKVWGPKALRRVNIQEKTKVGEYLIADDVEGLVALAQMDVIEVHPWNMRFEHLEQPDRVIIDLDPGPGVAWKEVVALAKRVREALREEGLESLVKTTGGNGVHVVAPFKPERDVMDVLDWSRRFCERLAADDPKRVTTSMAKPDREGRILLDYLRNNRTNTAVGAYSPRARPHAPVSMPIAWDELTARLKPDKFTVRTAVARSREVPDPWGSYSALVKKQRLRLRR